MKVSRLRAAAVAAAVTAALAGAVPAQAATGWPWGAEANVGAGWNDPARVRFADLNGDGRAELIELRTNGIPHAWTNNGAFPAWPWGGETDIGAGWAVPERMRFADLNGDGYDDLVELRPNGVPHAWLNNHQYPAWPWSTEADIGSGWPAPARVRFADLDGDGYTDLIMVKPNGVLHAWRNNHRFPAFPWGTEADVGSGWSAPPRMALADLNGDDHADLVEIRSSGVPHAWTNNGDYPAWPWGAEGNIGAGWTDPGRMLFADLNGDGYDDLVNVRDDGVLHAWTNNHAF
jgi:hypothetical protein